MRKVENEGASWETRRPIMICVHVMNVVAEFEFVASWAFKCGMLVRSLAAPLIRSLYLLPGQSPLVCPQPSPKP